MPATLAWMIPCETLAGGHGAQFAVDELEFLCTAIAGPVEKFVDGHPRGSEFGQGYHR